MAKFNLKELDRLTLSREILLRKCKGKRANSKLPRLADRHRSSRRHGSRDFATSRDRIDRRTLVEPARIDWTRAVSGLGCHVRNGDTKVCGWFTRSTSASVRGLASEGGGQSSNSFGRATVDEDGQYVFAVALWRSRHCCVISAANSDEAVSNLQQCDKAVTVDRPFRLRPLWSDLAIGSPQRPRDGRSER